MIEVDSRCVSVRRQLSIAELCISSQQYNSEVWALDLPSLENTVIIGLTLRTSVSAIGCQILLTAEVGSSAAQFYADSWLLKDREFLTLK